MFGSNGKISTRQSFFLFLFDFVGASSLIVPTYLAREVGAGGIFSILFGCVLGLLYLLFLHEIQQKMGTDLGTWLRNRITARKRHLIEVWLLLHCIAVVGFAAYLFSTLIQQHLLAAEHYPVILMVILVVAGYAVSGGIESRARVYEVLAVLIFVPLVLMLIASGTQMESAYLNEFLEADFGSLVKGGYLVFLFFAVAFWTLFFTGFLAETNGSSVQAGSAANTKNRADTELQKQTNQISVFYRDVAMAIILTAILLAAIFLICLGNFGEAALSQMDFPVITLMSSIKIPGNFVKRLDTIMIALWFFTLFAFLNLHIFYAVKMIEVLAGNVGCCHGKKNGSRYQDKNMSNSQGNSTVSRKGDRTGNQNASIIPIWIILLLSGILALFFHYNENILAWFETCIWYIGTPLLVLAPIFIYWAGRGKT